MITRPIAIDTALSPRLALVAQAMAERVEPGHWAGYRATEGLVTNLTRPSSLGGSLTVEAHRPSDPLAIIRMGFVSMDSITDESTLSATTIQDGITEQSFIDVDIPQNVKVTKTETHEFEHTETYSDSLQDTLKTAWEAGGKASLQVEYAGVKGAAEVFSKYAEERVQQVQRTASTATKNRDTISETFEFTGPAKFKLRAFRARKREQRVVRARCDFDGKIYWHTGLTGEDQPRVWEFTTFKTQFLPVARRTADSSIYGYFEFRHKPMTDAEIAALEAPINQLIEIQIPFDTIVEQSLTQV